MRRHYFILLGAIIIGCKSPNSPPPPPPPPLPATIPVHAGNIYRYEVLALGPGMDTTDLIDTIEPGLQWQVVDKPNSLTIITNRVILQSNKGINYEANGNVSINRAFGAANWITLPVLVPEDSMVVDADLLDADGNPVHSRTTLTPRNEATETINLNGHAYVTARLSLTWVTVIGKTRQTKEYSVYWYAPELGYFIKRQTHSWNVNPPYLLEYDLVEWK